MFHIVQIIDFTIKTKGNLIVHCHAGHGRTGLVIA